jgi:CheY-like chemotaxis protein
LQRNPYLILGDEPKESLKNIKDIIANNPSEVKLRNTIARFIKPQLVQAEETIAPQNKKETDDPHGNHILIVLDNRINQMLVTNFVSHLGYTYELVENGALAVEAFKNNFFSIVLMDCQMPIMDGYQATGEIRNLSSRGQKIPIIAITANAMQGDKEK